MIKESKIRQNLFKYIQGDCSPKELDETISLIRESSQKSDIRSVLFEHWENIETEKVKALEKSEVLSILDTIHHRVNFSKTNAKKDKKRKLFVTISQIAAVLIIGFVLGFLINNSFSITEGYHTSIAPGGSVSQMILPDGTIVYLNAGSTIKYPTNGSNKKREVFLNGEAWFDVEKNKHRPFIVHTSYYDIKVHGTQFNVKAYEDDNEVVTTLEEGIVEVLSTKDVKLQSNTVLQPGDQLIYNKNKNEIFLQKVHTPMYSAWKNNQLIFINMNLRELFVLIERKYGVNIKIVDSSILKYHYDGMIRDETIFEVLDILKTTLPIEYQIESQTIIITKK